MHCQLNLLLIITALCIPFAHLRANEAKCKGAKDGQYYFENHRCCKCSRCPTENPSYKSACSDYPLECGVANDWECVDEKYFPLTSAAASSTISNKPISHSSTSSTQKSSITNNNPTQNVKTADIPVTYSSTAESPTSQLAQYTTGTMRVGSSSNRGDRPPEAPTVTLIGICVAILVITSLVFCIIFRKCIRGRQTNLTGALSKIKNSICNPSITQQGDAEDASDSRLIEGRVDEKNPEPNCSPIPQEEVESSPASFSGPPGMGYSHNVHVNSGESDRINMFSDSTSVGAGSESHFSDSLNVPSPSTQSGCINTRGNNNAVIQATNGARVNIGTMNVFSHPAEACMCPMGLNQSNRDEVTFEGGNIQQSVPGTRQEPSGQESSYVASRPTYPSPVAGMQCVTNAASSLSSDITEPLKSDAHSSVDTNYGNADSVSYPYQQSAQRHRPNPVYPGESFQMHRTHPVPVQHSSQAETDDQLSAQNSSYSITYPPVADSEKLL